MDEADQSIASAVIIPAATEQAPPFHPAPSLKRRQSSVSVADNKRARLSSSSHSPRSPAPPADRPRRVNHQAEERKRGQRLFGALLGTLSASANSDAHTRRRDIEKRQKRKLAEQFDEASRRHKERMDELELVRKREQEKFDKELMRSRHENTLTMAHFLCTKTVPPIYYKPWELRPEDTNQIEEQVVSAKAEIEAELAALEQRRIDEAKEKENKARMTNVAAPPAESTDDLAIPPQGHQADIEPSYSVGSELAAPSGPAADEGASVSQARDDASPTDTVMPDTPLESQPVSERPADDTEADKQSRESLESSADASAAHVPVTSAGPQPPQSEPVSTSTDAPTTLPAAPTPEGEGADEQNGDVLFEAEEDTVIY
ncbi:hypothetical protein EJ06DRAFT_509691 [Trichodelitschia bisporula]|uniref:Pinin/SDK/MemA protein domain-containing protein n=1 Tax=Trichodelitschia bisporula TaxID=703511 RepID=A0A6G1HY81_9PEZI|nr:hypothetical protein EJ06DRAFT_509691 [Trichodelitschia bisporula]